MLRFASLGSGSRGNATLIEGQGTLVLVDCGFSLAEVEQRLARLGRTPSELSGILVTHEHGDHTAGVAALARRNGVPVWASAGTLAAWDPGEGIAARAFNADEPFALGGLEVRPYPVPHDAREPCQFVIGDGAQRVGVLSDSGTVTPHIRRCLAGCDALLVEANHDPEMLASGPYPAPLKARVGGRWGHLNNTQAAQLVAALGSAGLQHLVVGHLSAQNNTPARARGAIADAIACDPDWIGVADQDAGLDWRDVR